MIKLIFADNGAVMILKDVNGKIAKATVPADTRLVKKIKRLMERVWRYSQ